jgi:hypothetical protein
MVVWTSNSFWTVPVIAVFTKYDLLVSRTRWNISRAGLSPEQVAKCVQVNADAFFQKECGAPFESIIQNGVPYLTVSGK